MGGAIHALGVTTGIAVRPVSVRRGSRTAIIQDAALGDAVDLGRRDFEFARRVRLILRPWRKIRSYGFWLIGLTALLTMLFDLAFDPFASRVKHYWLWVPTKFPLTWQGAPLVNFFKLGGRGAADAGVCHPGAHQQKSGPPGAGFSSARRVAWRDFAFRDRVRGTRNVDVRHAGRGHCRSGRNVRHSRRRW